MTNSRNYRYGDREILIGSLILIGLIVIAFAALFFLSTSPKKTDSDSIELDQLPPNVETWILRGDIARLSDRHRRAVLHYDQALEKDSGSAAAWFGRSLSLSALDMDREAMQSLNKAIGIDPENREFLYYRNVMVSEMRQGAVSSTGDTEKVTISPADYEAWARLGWYYWTKKNLVLSSAAFDTAMQANPDWLPSLHGAALTLSLSKKTDSAKVLLIRAFSIDSTNSMGWHILGMNLELSGQYREAIDAYQRALSINPDRSRSWLLMARCAAELRIDSLREHSLLQAYSYEPDYVPIAAELGFYYYDRDRFEESLPYFKVVDELSPLDSQTTEYYVSALVLCEKCPEALTLIASLPANRRDTSMLISQAYCLQLTGKYQEALSTLENVLKQSPNSSLSLNNYADALNKIGKRAAALDTIDRALQVATDSTDLVMLKITRQEILDSMAADRH
jgi:tetratricopeptide (TPR) repeat protein